METLTWHLKNWDELTATELYRILQLRVDVFVVEQNCPYPELDGKDLKCAHLWVSDSTGRVHAYSRLVPPGVSYNDASIGRVVSSQAMRRDGLGREVMKRSIERQQATYPNMDIRISAQSYLQKFYESFGFVVEGEEYLEDDIPHKEMVLKYSL
jgi:ElaA protein